LLVAVIACGCRARPEGPVDTVAGLLHEERETLILYLGNESDERDWIDIEVAIDEKEIVKDRLRSYHDDLRMPRPRKSLSQKSIRASAGCKGVMRRRAA